MEPITKIECELYSSVWLWFIPYAADSAMTLITGDTAGNQKFSFNFNYDYEKPGFNQWKIHIDAGFDVKPVAKICVRSSFKARCTELNIFKTESLNELIKYAFKECLKGFNEQCKVHGLQHDWKPEIKESMITSFAETAIEQYFNSRKQGDASNSKLQTAGLKLTPGSLTNLAVKCTFMIMDEILFLNAAFDTKRNREIFNEIIPVPYYYTLKMNCLEIDKENVQLTWLHTIFYFLCMECALQMLIGDHYETLKPAVETRGLDSTNATSFISFGTKLLADLQEHLKSSGATISNLEKKYDWNNLIH